MDEVTYYKKLKNLWKAAYMALDEYMDDNDDYIGIANDWASSKKQVEAYKQQLNVSKKKVEAILKEINDLEVENNRTGLKHE